MKKEGELIERYFLLLLIDATKFCYLAQDPQIDRFLERSYSRSGIISSAILLESLANILIEKIDGKQFREDLDKLPFLSKIDAYLASKGMPSIDRGSKEAQGAVEIKRIRDAFVHPKRKRHTAMRINAADEFSFNLVFPKNKTTGISTSPSHWGKDEALKALTMSIAFIRHVLKDRLRLSSDDVFLTVSSSIILGKDQGLISETELCDTVDDAKKMRIDLSFLIPADIVEK